MPGRIIFLIFLLSFTIISVLTEADDTIRNSNFSWSEHAGTPFSGPQLDCPQCHRDEELKSILKDPVTTCETICLKCHKNIERHHKVGAKIKETIPGKLRLTRNKRISCFTCHNLNIKRYDKISWRAESLFESIFRSKSKYNTYYLTIKNNDGQLCKECH